MVHESHAVSDKAVLPVAVVLPVLCFLVVGVLFLVSECEVAGVSESWDNV